MRIARGGLRLRVSEQASDDWQRHPRRDQVARVGVPRVVDSHVFDLRLLAELRPRPFDLVEGLFCHIAREKMRVTFGLSFIKARS